MAGIGILIGIYLVATNYYAFNQILQTGLSGLTSESALLQGRGKVGTIAGSGSLGF
jgi:hypothetical protein